MRFNRAALALVAIGSLACGGAVDRMLVVTPNGRLIPLATTSVVGGDTSQSIRTRVTLINAGTNPVPLAFGACVVRVLAYTAPARTGTPVWDSDRRRGRDGKSSSTCPKYSASGTVQPGEALSPGEFIFVAPLAEMLADSLPDGKYYFSADLRIESPLPIRGIPAGSLELATRRVRRDSL